MATVKDYYSLTKPGVLYGNAITAAAGFLLAARGHVNIWLFVALVVGSTLMIASACVLNNFLDQDIDSKMARTKKRAIVAGKVKGRDAVILSIVLGVFGLALLALYTNWLVVAVGIVGYVDYVVLYGMLSKRLSMHGTLVGSISGAVPVLAGYLAVSNAFDAGAIIVFAAMFLWQMPEFYSIAVYRQKEYAAAGVPVITVVKGIEHTRVQIFLYTLAFVVVMLLLTPYGYTGYSYLTVMGFLGAYWLWLASKGLYLGKKNSDAWAKSVFKFSLIILLAFCAMIAVGPLLP